VDVDPWIALLQVGVDAPRVSALVEWLRPEWHRDAACVEYPVEWWFPERGQSPARALAICETCPVRAECLTVGLTSIQGAPTVGIWGGATGRQRRTMEKVKAPRVSHAEQVRKWRAKRREMARRESAA
jgi:WhiB family redox-sensing transcriptional regulator